MASLGTAPFYQQRPPLPAPNGAPGGRRPSVLFNVPLPDSDAMDSDSDKGPARSDSEMETDDAFIPAPPESDMLSLAAARPARSKAGAGRGHSRSGSDFELRDPLAVAPFESESERDHAHQYESDGGEGDGDGSGSEADGSEVDLSEVDVEAPSPPASPRTRPRSHSMSAAGTGGGRKGAQGGTKLPRAYPCTHAGCKKVYKNPGGLKYHLLYGHPDPNNPPNPPGFFGRSGKRGRNAPDAYKPYKCCVAGCGKRYKNMNGLKYHLEHAHQDLRDDPSALPYTVRSSGRREWNLAACYDPLTVHHASGPASTSAAASLSISPHGRRPHHPPAPGAQPFGDGAAEASPPRALPKRRGKHRAAPSQSLEVPYPEMGGLASSAPAAVFLHGTPRIAVTPAGPSVAPETTPAGLFGPALDVAGSVGPTPSLAGALAAAATALRTNVNYPGPVDEYAPTEGEPSHYVEPDDEPDRLGTSVHAHAGTSVTTAAGSLDPLRQLLAAAAIVSAPAHEGGVARPGKGGAKPRGKAGKKSEDEDTVKVDGSGSEGVDGAGDEMEEGMLFKMDDE